MAEFDWGSALLGGILIGLSATLLLLLLGRIAGVSGMVHTLVAPPLAESSLWRWLFLVGLVLGTAIYEYGLASSPTPTSPLAPMAMILGGFLVGFGTRQGNGCTSGHGVCGLGRLSPRSLVAVLVFVVTGVITVFVMRHML
ncbi:MAG: YeeE/YedE family protein [Caldilineaceae bacterium]